MTSLVTAAQIATVRRMVAEPLTTTYTDDLITAFIETYPHIDEQGEEPFTLSSATPPVHETNENWMPTYDLNAAAADIWQEKAANWITQHDFSADGGNYSVSQVYDMMMKQVRYYRARKRPTSVTVHKYPDEGYSDDPVWIGNNPEPD